MKHRWMRIREEYVKLRDVVKDVSRGKNEYRVTYD